MRRSWIKTAGAARRRRVPPLRASAGSRTSWAGIATTRRFQYNDRENAGPDPGLLRPAVRGGRRSTPPDGVPLAGWWVPAAERAGHGRARPRPEPQPHRDGQEDAVPARARAGTRCSSTCATTGERRRRCRASASFEKQDVHAAAELRARRARRARWCSGASPWARPRPPWPPPRTRRSPALVCDSSYRSLRDTVDHHMTLARSWRWWMRVVPPWPVGGRGAVLDRAAGRVRPRRGGRPGRGGAPGAGGRPCSSATPATAACPRRSRST